MRFDVMPEMCADCPFGSSAAQRAACVQVCRPGRFNRDLPVSLAGRDISLPQKQPLMMTMANIRA